ncbi:GntR family transcriptional regulator [Labrys okinawensis]|uniref:GntR family transcriptional regulator n=1 Tax=Labrys okinawensis TaxID=346911 RepID=A0A2S9Q3F9_9HYPH|nr:FadR/GntR family transcriptional regulator [Labrys okinawensis]PRH83898.1 GntR family transcriptional regulator [Labrys okinawensis]
MDKRNAATTDTEPRLTNQSRGSGSLDGIADRPGRTPLVQRVYHILLTKISRGDYLADEKLPGEHELASTLLVSRPIIREALKLLRDEGLIYSRQGAGSFVKKLAEDTRNIGYSPVETIADIQRCYELRMSIEPDHAYYAALRWNEPALAKIAAALELMRDAVQLFLHRDDADYNFHYAISQATNNHFYVLSMQSLRDHISIGMKFHGVSLAGPEAMLADVFAEHQLIFDAIRRREAEAARDIMHRHLKRSRDRVFEGRILDLSL